MEKTVHGKRSKVFEESAKSKTGQDAGAENGL